MFKSMIIKPSRFQAKSPPLKNSRAIKNAKKGIETALIFDLNILSKMHEVVTGEISLNDSGLKQLVSILNSTVALSPTPGFAIQEMDQDLMKSVTKSFDRFFNEYCKNYSDHPNSTRNFENVESKPRGFQKLTISEKYLNSVAYLGILKIQLIERTESSLPPIEKFQNYIDYMASSADLLGAIEAEAAKYVFFDSSKISDEKLRVFSRKIKENFKKGGKTVDKLLQRCLNSARDIMYYRLTAQLSNELIDGKTQDTWLVTGDIGLANLSESIHFIPNVDKSDSKYINVVRRGEQKKSLYWNFCDELFNSTVGLRRQFNEEEFSESDYERLLTCIRKIETELKQTFA